MVSDLKQVTHDFFVTFRPFLCGKVIALDVEKIAEQLSGDLVERGW